MDWATCRWIDCTLRNKTVDTPILSETLAIQVVKGCPYGRVLCSFLWSLVADEPLIRCKSHPGLFCALVIISQCIFNNTVRKRMQEALSPVEQQTNGENLITSPSKSTTFLVTRKRNMERLEPPLLWGKIMQMLKRGKYLRLQKIQRQPLWQSDAHTENMGVQATGSTLYVYQPYNPLCYHSTLSGNSWNIFYR